jgi:hypothetical protein
MRGVRTLVLEELEQDFMRDARKQLTAQLSFITTYDRVSANTHSMNK